LLADGLESRPASSVGGRTRQPKFFKVSTAAEVGQLKSDAPAVMVKREIVLGVEPSLGQRSILLRGRRLRGIGEIERRGDAGALPAPIAGSPGASEEV
jgi:hypothetical protein